MMQQKVRNIVSKLCDSWIVWFLVGAVAILQWYYWPRSMARELGKISPALVSQDEVQQDADAETGLSVFYWQVMEPDGRLSSKATSVTNRSFGEKVQGTTVWRRSREDLFSNGPVTMAMPQRCFARTYEGDGYHVWIYVSDQDEIIVNGSDQNGRGIQRSWVDFSHRLYADLYAEAFPDAPME